MRASRGPKTSRAWKPGKRRQPMLRGVGEAAGLLEWVAGRCAGELATGIRLYGRLTHVGSSDGVWDCWL